MTPDSSIGTRPTPNGASRFMRSWLYPFLAVHAIFFVLWGLGLARNGPASTDWRMLKVVADHFVAGDWSRLYAVGNETLLPGYFWRYPPFTLYLFAPLAWLPDVWAYGALIVVEIAALAASLWLLRRTAPFREMRAEWCLAIALSPPVLTVLVAGQSSALILLCISAAAWLWTSGRSVAACAVLGLLAIKPNWGIIFGLMVLARREWRGTAAMVAVVALLCLSTVPLGADLWIDFLGGSVQGSLAMEGYAAQKQITLRGFLDGMLGRGEPALVIWALAAAGLIVAAVAAWRSPNLSPLGCLGVGVLLAVAANPYGFFYDALVLAVPGTAWWAHRAEWRRGPWLAVGTLIALAWCGEQWLYSWGLLVKLAGLPWLPPVSVVGAVTAAWLVLAAHQARRPADAAPARVPAPLEVRVSVDARTA